MRRRKAPPQHSEGRIREVVSDPNNAFIPRVPEAGNVIDGTIVLHNGIRTVTGVYGDLSRVFEVNKGVHEPQEERVFAEVLPHLPRGATMLELGSYWGFYSMWFLKDVPGGRCFLVEPDPANLEIGKRNFAINGFVGDFAQGSVGSGPSDITVDGFLEERGVEHLHLLHADIQGAEVEMLRGARLSMRGRAVDYFFISTHGQRNHNDCSDILVASGYTIIASADYDWETYCFDGVLVARRSELSGPGRIEIHVANWAGSPRKYYRLVRRACQRVLGLPRRQGR